MFLFKLFTVESDSICSLYTGTVLSGTSIVWVFSHMSTSFCLPCKPTFLITTSLLMSEIESLSMRFNRHSVVLILPQGFKQVQLLSQFENIKKLMNIEKKIIMFKGVIRMDLLDNVGLQTCFRMFPSMLI